MPDSGYSVFLMIVKIPVVLGNLKKIQDSKKASSEMKEKHKQRKMSIGGRKTDDESRAKFWKDK